MLLDRQTMSFLPRATVFLCCIFALVFLAVYHVAVYSNPDIARTTTPSVTPTPHHITAAPGFRIPDPEPPKPPPTLEETIQSLFSPVKHPDFVSPFKDSTNTVYTHNNSLWTKPLGKKLLLVDVDTRYPEMMFNPNKSIDWASTDNLVSQAVFNHYLYANIHGYDYKYYRPDPVEGHHKTWPKVHSILNLLPEYQFVVFFDADATIRHLGLPFEWLLNRWNVTDNTSFTMARDPLDNDCNLCDSNGVPMVNTGFVITQNLPYTYEIFDVWMKCTAGDTKYGDCPKWKEQWAHEQSVFSDYLRYDYNPHGDNIRELECGEANGFPGHGWYDPVDCNGKFIRHHTFVKSMTKETVSNSLAQAFIDVIKGNFAIKPEIVVSESEEKKKLREEEEYKQALSLVESKAGQSAGTDPDREEMKRKKIIGMDAEALTDQ